jgi:hypothetical protein
MSNSINNEKKKLAVKSLEEIIMIINGLTITNAVVILLTNGTYNTINSLKNISLNNWVLFIVLITNIIRFNHGNIRLLDDYYIIQNEDNKTRLNILPFDFFAIFTTCLLFAFISFYINSYLSFFSLFLIIFIIDILWYLITSKECTNLNIQKQRRVWFLNNFIFLIPLALFLFMFTNYYNLYTLSLILLVNTGIDYWLSWNFYFPHGD